MKKLILMLAVLSCTGVFAAEFLGWNCNDKTALQSAVAAKDKYSSLYAVRLALLENANAFSTYADVKKFAEEKQKAAGSKEYPAWLIVYSQMKYLGKFNKDAYNEQIEEKRYNNALLFLTNRDLGMSALEAWRTSMNILIDHKINSDLVTVTFKKLFASDIRIPKADKVELYSLLYEKYMPELANEQNLAANKKVYTPILGKIALKLKALGVNVVK